MRHPRRTFKKDRFKNDRTVDVNPHAYLKKMKRAVKRDAKTSFFMKRGNSEIATARLRKELRK